MTAARMARKLSRLARRESTWLLLDQHSWIAVRRNQEDLMLHVMCRMGDSFSSARRRCYEAQCHAVGPRKDSTDPTHYTPALSESAAEQLLRQQPHFAQVHDGHAGFCQRFDVQREAAGLSELDGADFAADEIL